MLSMIQTEFKRPKVGDVSFAMELSDIASQKQISEAIYITF